MIRKIDYHMHPIGDDPGMEKYLKLMDKYNVTHGVIHGLILDTMGYVGNGGNEGVAKAVKAHKDRFFGTVCVNFLDGNDKVLDEIKKYGDLGFIGIKLFPNLGFSPNDEKYEPIFAELEKRGMICFSHCGWLGPDPGHPERRMASLDGGSPFHFEVPARRHPKVKFIFAHFGGGATYLETIVLCSRLPNAYADTCPGWGRWVFDNNLSGIQAMPKDRLLYGTDNAGDSYGLDDQWWTKKLTSLGWSYDNINQYFWYNSARILGLFK